MSRIIELTGVNVTTEVVSPVTEIHWNPTTNDGSVVFHTSRMLWIDGEYVSTNREAGFAVNISEIMQKTFTINLPDGGTFEMPGILLMAGIKQAFHDLYEEKHA